MKNQKKKRTFFRKKKYSVEKSKFANRLKRALPKFRGDRSEVRGINGRSKFVAASAERKRPMPFGGAKLLWEGVAYPVGFRRVGTCFCNWGASWLQVGSKIAFFCVLFARCFKIAFFSVFRWFFNGFWEVWGGIWECFGKVFPWFFPKMRFLKK